MRDIYILSVIIFFRNCTPIFEVSLLFICLKIEEMLRHRNRMYFLKEQHFLFSFLSPSLAASIEPLTHRRNVASLSLFYRYYFDRCSSELAQLVPLPYSRGRSTRYSDR